MPLIRIYIKVLLSDEVTFLFQCIASYAQNLDGHQRKIISKSNLIHLIRPWTKENERYYGKEKIYPNQ